MAAAAPMRGIHPIAELEQNASRFANTRRFVGDGNPFLAVPGLRRLESVRCGGVEIPLTETRSWPTDLSLRNFETETLTLIHLTHLPDGTPILLRNQVSNDGVWQAHANFDIAGEWDPDVPAGEPPVDLPQPVKKGSR
jgi:hypothetical protein